MIKRACRHLSADSRFALNAICPYFTMFPLEYPLRTLDPVRLRSYRSPVVCDPYCGRGTTVFAARHRGLPVYGIDIAPVAVAIARAKLADTTTEEVMSLLAELLEETPRVDIPTGQFWEWAFDPQALEALCKIRAGLRDRRNSAAVLLRAVMLGALHGPRAKSALAASYFSNQMPRTFAAKPNYAVRFWKRQRRKPPRVDLLAIIQKRTARVLNAPLRCARTLPADVQCADSRSAAAFNRLEGKITHVVTSPPYYGLRTYSQDQWLREWFLGGPTTVNYRKGPGLDHGSPESFAKSLAEVWDNIGHHASSRIKLHVRFGGIGSRKAVPDDILRHSLKLSTHPWRVLTRHTASSANVGKRQAVQMQATADPIEESDYVVILS